MARTLILAYGNALRGDDAVGWHIAAALEDNPLCPGIEVVAAHQLGPEMAERISQVESVIFVDASVTHEPGSIRFERVSPSWSGSGSFTHELNPAALLALAEALYGRAPTRAFALSVGVESLELNEDLTESVRASIPEAVHTILGYLARQVSLPKRATRTVMA
ncbi:MAG TPA: hydrogenase maturation protease [Methylomirabilota bacterium]|nr:hydrogenase maturation protease [Methylomirabilota bacterium]